MNYYDDSHFEDDDDDDIGFNTGKDVGKNTRRKKEALIDY